VRDGITGVLNLVKPVGMTSYDVVARVRRLSGQKSVGHAGTLDPLAQGVLVILLGRATALSAYAMSSNKQYAAEIVFGAATTTDDAEGEIIREAAAPVMTELAIAARLQSLTGDVLQAPPRFSAIKMGGKTAYAEARKGRELKLEPRRVRIDSIEILSWYSPRLRLLVTTGPGAYVRSLARDAGELLESAAYLHSLIRVGSGRFRLEDGVSIECLTRENLVEHVLPADTVVAHLRAAYLSEADTDRARHGGAVPLGGADPRTNDEVIRLYGSHRTLVALARPSPEGWRPFRVLEPVE
jgi:tRNA pseudouridine55 synthase